MRRGVPAAHLLCGEGPSINAGSACYFLPQLFLGQAPVTAEVKARIYELYLEACRAAHAGQALDLDGLVECLRPAAEAGDGALAERRVRAVHRLKSAAPAGALARAGAVLGGGSEAQIEALGAFVEQVGLAFQIVDDVLNLEGFERDLKARGEDLATGKVTMPVAKAVGRLSYPDRRRLWEILADPSGDWGAIQEAIDLVTGCGALAACRQEAGQLVEDGWRRLDPLLPDSRTKVLLRAFSWFVLDRHY
jgi:geranylgeranyl pyrophosphate synthase